MSDYNSLNEEAIAKLQDDIIREHLEEKRYLSNKSLSSLSKDQSQSQQQQQQQHLQQLSQQEEDILNNMPFNKSTFASAHTLFSKNASEMKFQDSVGEARDQNTFSNRNRIDNNKSKSSKDNRLETELEYSTFNGQSKSMSYQEVKNENKSSRSNLPLQKSVKKTIASSEKQGISEGQFEDMRHLESNQEEEIQDLKLYIQDLEQEISFLKPAANQCEELWRDIEMMKTKEVKLTEYIIELENKLQNQSSSIRNSTIDKLDNMSNELIDKNIAIQQQNALIQELQHQISRLKDNNDCWKSQVDKERQENQELRTYREKNEEQREDSDENKKYKDLYMEMYEQNQEEKISSQNKVFQLEQEVQSLISQMNRMQTQINYESQIQHKNAEILELEELLEKKDNQIQDIDQTFQLAKDEIASLHTQIELLKERIDQLETQIYQKDTILDEMQNSDYEEKIRNFIQKEQLFDEMANNVCLFINCLRKSTFYSQLQSSFHEDFLTQIINHNVEIIDYYQLDTFLSASLKQLESFMNNGINEKQENENRLQYLYEADLKVDQLTSEIDHLKREREDLQPKAIESHQIQEYQKQVELTNYQKIDLEVKNKQLQESVKILKGEFDHIHGKHNNKIEKKRIFFEKMIESILKAVNSKQLNELCEEIIDKVKDIDKRKITKLTVEKKILEIDAEIKINLAKQSQKDIEPLKKFKQQKTTELDDVLQKISKTIKNQKIILIKLNAILKKEISNQKMWSAYEKMKETCLYEKRVKEDLVDCERDYLKLKIQFEETRKKYENSSCYSKSFTQQQQQQCTQVNKQQIQSQKTFRPPLKTGAAAVSQNGSSQYLENELIMHILSSDIQSGAQTTARIFRESRSTSQMAANQKQISQFTNYPQSSQNYNEIQQQQQQKQNNNNNNNNNNYNSENVVQKQKSVKCSSQNRNANIIDSFNDRAINNQRGATMFNDRSLNDENDINQGNIQSRDTRYNVIPKGSNTQRQPINNKQDAEVIMSLKDKLEKNKKHLSLNARK